MSSTTTLSGYTPPHVDYQTAGIGDKAIHEKAVQIANERPPAVHLTLSKEAQIVMAESGK